MQKPLATSWDKPFYYNHENILVLINRADMSRLNYIVCPPGTSEEEVVRAITCFTAYWVTFVHPNLDSFAGFHTAKWTIVREYCDYSAMVHDHMSGDLTYNLDYSDNFVDASSDSGFENVNLVDRHRLTPEDPRHPHYKEKT